MKHYMVMDVESIGLHGEGFWVAYVIIDETGEEHWSAQWASNPDEAVGAYPCHLWVKQNVPGICDATYMDSAHEMRELFWRAWRRHKKDFPGITLWADCSWPVEARFLAACVDDDPKPREWEGPYPLHDVATARLMAGLDPLSHEERLPTELPEHNPLADARQSARLLIEAMQKLGLP